MTLEQGLHAFLASRSGVSTLVSTRIYPVILPQAPRYPAITYNRVSRDTEHHLLGPVGRDVARISINSWASTYAGAKALADTVRLALDGYRGPFLSLASPAVLITTVGATHLDNEIDLYEEDAEDPATQKKGIFRVLQDYFISHTESI